MARVSMAGARRSLPEAHAGLFVDDPLCDQTAPFDTETEGQACPACQIRHVVEADPGLRLARAA